MDKFVLLSDKDKRAYFEVAAANLILDRRKRGVI